MKEERFMEGVQFAEKETAEGRDVDTRMYFKMVKMYATLGATYRPNRIRYWMRKAENVEHMMKPKLFRASMQTLAELGDSVGLCESMEARFKRFELKEESSFTRIQRSRVLSSMLATSCLEALIRKSNASGISKWVKMMKDCGTNVRAGAKEDILEACKQTSENSNWTESEFKEIIKDLQAVMPVDDRGHESQAN